MFIMSSLGKVFSFIGGLFLVSAIFVGGAYFGYYERPAVEKVLSVVNKDTPQGLTSDSVDFDPFWKSWSIIEEKYVSKDGLNKQDMVWGAIEGLAKSLDDPYTVFFPPAEKEMFESQIRGDFEGVGMEIGIRKNTLTVIAPLKNTPAYNAGIKSGDKIIKIDDTITIDMSLEEAVKLIRGPKGTEVVLTVLRNGADKTEDIKIIRDRIEIPSIETEKIDIDEMASDDDIDGDGTGIASTEGASGKNTKKEGADDGIFVIRLFNFNENSQQAFRSALREMSESGKNKLILDLRSNPGGYLEIAVDMASWFLPMGKIVVRENFGNNNETLYRSRGYNIFEGVPTVVLINEGSASASEILAGALQDYDKAVLIGKKTFGKGSVQEFVPITTDTALKVTIARWMTPNGRSISEDGLNPDIEVDITEDDFKEGRDPQMDKAIEVLRGR